jgi:UDP-4-amino-4,6-dideoxy-N-acetyl-beta-L-altrosamine transaminase
MTNQKIPYSCQQISDDDIDAVVGVLKSELITQGPQIPKFERKVGKYVGAEYAFACNSATSALHIACLSLGISNDDMVWVPAISFVATANCVLYCGAKVDFVDIDISTNNMCLVALEKKLEAARIKGSLPKVIIAVHMCGTPVDMKQLFELSKTYGFKVIEDASHALGAKSGSHFVGYCEFSDLTVFSFHPVKMITTGEGGMVLTQDSDLADKILKLRSHGITGDVLQFDERPEQEIWNYQQVALGYNYRITDIQAALGISQMNKLSHFVERRNQIASYYTDCFKNLNLRLQTVNKGDISSFHLYTIQTQGNIQKSLHKYLLENNIMVNLHYIPIYRQPYYQKLGFEIGYCPNAETYFKSVLSIPVHTRLLDEQVSFIADLVKGFTNGSRKN